MVAIGTTVIGAGRSVDYPEVIGNAKQGGIMPADTFGEPAFRRPVDSGAQDWLQLDGMKLYVCWGTFPVPWPRRGRTWRPSGHPCKNAHDALKEAGHSPEVVKSYGLAPLPDVTSGRKEVKRLTGESLVPVLVLDDGEIIKSSSSIEAWARANPAG